MNQSSNPRLRLLVESLLNRTQSTGPDRISWESGRNEDSYELSLTNSTIAISSRDGDSLPPFIFEIMDGSGRTIESIDSQTSELDLGDLYQAISRSHSGIDAKLGEIFDELGISEPPF